MDKKTISKTLERLKTISQKRKFKQSIELIITFRSLDLSKVDNQVDQFVTLHYTRGKPIKICGLIGPELLEQAKKDLDKAISVDGFIKYQKDKKAVKKLAKEYDFFIAQVNIMPKVAQTFGRVFGPRQKMPNPKAGCVVPPNANLKAIKENLQKTVRVAVKQKPMLLCMVGKEDQKDEEVVDNVMSIYNALVHSLPSEEQNIKRVFLKLTMSKPLEIGVTEEKNE